MPIPITTSTDPNVLRIDLANLYYDEIEQDTTYQGVVDMKGSDYSPTKEYVETHSMSGLGPMIERGESDTFAVDAPGPGDLKRSVYKGFALRVKFTERLILMQRFDLVAKVVQDLRRSYDLRRNMDVAALYDGFFGTTLYTGPDGLALGSAAHTGAPGVANRSNILSTAAAFSYEGLQNLITVMRRQRNERGLRTPAIKGNDSIHVQIPPEMEWEAERLFNSAANLEPGTDTNSINVLKKHRWQVTVNHHLTSTANWFLMNPTETGIRLVDFQGLTPATTPDPLSTHGVQHDVRCMYVIHPEMWQKIYGSNG